MAKNKTFIHTFRNVLVILSTLLMIAVVVFQCLEISEYGIWQHIQDTIKAQFQPSVPPTTSAAAADQAAPAGGQPAAAQP